jgi:hypothetical protein
MVIRNIGPGPALEIISSKLWEGARPWTTSSFNAAVIPAGGEWLLQLNGFSARDLGVRVQYRDLAGLRYTTEIRAGVNAVTHEAGVGQVTISRGELDPEIPRPAMGDPMMYTPPGLRGRWRAARRELFPPLTVRRPAPLWRRIIAAGRAARVGRTATLTQRIRFGVEQARRIHVSTEVPRRVPRFFAPIVVLRRRYKIARQGFRGYRGG